MLPQEDSLAGGVVITKSEEGKNLREKKQKKCWNEYSLQSEKDWSQTSKKD
jgi:hypothetical protein